MNTSIQHFDNLELDTHIRVIELNEQVLFVAKDVCDALGIQNSRDTLAKCLDPDEKQIIKPSNVENTDFRIPNRGLQVVNESGLYSLIFRSTKEAAQKFRKWVTSEVLPAIRQHGKYDPAELAAQMPPLVRRAYLLAQMEELEGQIIRLKAEADMAGVIPGQFTIYQWLLMQGEEPTNCGVLSVKCKKLAAQRGIAIGSAKVIEHCGQITRLSRTAFTYPEEILKEVCGEAAS